jgi:hypothetical protein
MTIEEDIKSVIYKLDRLQLEQSELIKRLDQLNTRRETENRASAPPSNPAYVPPVSPPNDVGFSLGDRVVIVNPGRNQENNGKVVKISDSTFLSNTRIVVETPTKQRIQRAPKNLRHDLSY